MCILTAGTRVVSDSYTGCLDPTPHSGSFCPDLIRGKVLRLTAFDISCFIDTRGRLALSWMKTEEGMGEGVWDRRWIGEGLGGENEG